LRKKTIGPNVVKIFHLKKILGFFFPKKDCIDRIVHFYFYFLGQIWPPKKMMLLSHETDAFNPLQKDSQQKNCFHKSTMTLVMMIVVGNARRPQ